MRKKVLRKSTPPWSLPFALWSLVLLPTRISSDRRKLGVGSARALPPLHQFTTILVECLAQVRQTGHMPWQWNAAQTIFLQKPGKSAEMCNQRLISMLDGFASIYWAAIWRQTPSTANRSWAFGYAPFRSREHAVISQLCLGWKSSNCKMSHVTLLYDMQNAFLSTQRERLYNAVVRHTQPKPDNLPLLWTHLQCLRLQLRDGEDVQWILPKAGVPPGGSFAAERFSIDYKTLLDERVSNTTKRAISCTMPWLGDKVHQPDVSLTVYADDICRKTLGETILQIHSAVNTLEHSLDGILSSSSYQQNRSKKEMVPTIFNKGGRQTMRRLCREHRLGCKAGYCARYLGYQYHMFANSQPDRDRRLQKATQTMAILHTFWSKAPSRVAKMVFRCAVTSHLEAGVTATVPRRLEFVLLDRLVCEWGRMLLQGRASGNFYDQDQQLQYDPWPNKRVLQYLGWGGFEIETKSQRLRFWQNVIKNNTQFAQFLALVLGQLPQETQSSHNPDDTVADSANPWLRLLVQDIDSLRKFDDYQGLVEAMEGKPTKLLTDCYVADLFDKVDPNIFRADVLYFHATWSQPSFRMMMMKSLQCLYVVRKLPKELYVGKFLKHTEHFVPIRVAHKEGNMAKFALLPNLPSPTIAGSAVRFLHQYLRHERTFDAVSIYYDVLVEDQRLVQIGCNCSVIHVLYATVIAAISISSEFTCSCGTSQRPLRGRPRPSSSSTAMDFDMATLDETAKRRRVGKARSDGPHVPSFEQAIAELAVAQAKLMLATAQRTRQLSAATTITFVVGSSHRLVASVDAANKLYEQEVAKNKNHGLGPPDPWRLKAFLMVVQASTEKEAQKQASGAYPTGETRSSHYADDLALFHAKTFY